MSLLPAILLVLRQQLVRTLRSRRTLVCAVLAALPVLLAAALALLPLPDGPRRAALTAGQRIAWNFVVQGIVPVLGLIAGAAVISEELEDRTVTFLFTRPVPRAAFLLGRWLAALVWLSVLVVASIAGVLVLLDTPLLDPDAVVPAWRLPVVLCGSAIAGCAVYSAGFAALGTRFRHPMILGLAYTFAIELFLANLPGRTRAVTVQYHLRSLAAEWAGPWVHALEGFRGQEFDGGPEALLKLALTVVVALALGAWVLSRRQYVMSS